MRLKSDLKISVKQLQIFLELYDELPWKALNYTAGQCNYGGRVTDDKDRRCLMAILQSYYNASVLEPNHKISPSGDWLMPDDMTWDEYNQFIEEFREALIKTVAAKMILRRENYREYGFSRTE